MKKGIHNYIFITIAIWIMICGLLPGHTQAETSPTLNKGEKWRIGYYEGGPYTEYVTTMRTLITGLMELDWIEKTDVPVYEGEISEPYWEWLTSAKSKHLSFAFCSEKPLSSSRDTTYD